MGKVSFPDAPAYDGPAPHPIVVVGFNDGSATPDGKVPTAWKPQRAEIQLIGCIDGVNEGNPTLQMPCHFNVPTSRDIPAVETTTQLSLYEARTGRKVADVSVPSGPAICPGQMTVSSDDPKVRATPGYEEYEKALSYYVDK
jgi:hypothetical protein